MTGYKFKIVTPACVGVVPHLWMALNFSLARRDSEKAAIYIYCIKDTK